jgi:Na+-transporting methylmalonyl-CoA/oxaloacetate decarboxylase gamma subunit
LLTNTNHENIFLMENISNLSVLFNILFNGMITVFIVLFLVYIIGKVIIYFFDSDASTNNDDSDLKESVSQKIKDIAGGEAKIISFRKLD